MRRSIRLRNSHSQLRAVRRWLLRIAIASFVAGWLSILLLAAPFVAHSESVNLDSYGATASGWAIQLYVLNDEFLNIPATDESTPYVFVAIDNTPSANARAAYFYPGTAISAVLNNENAGAQIPNGVAANYPGTGSASSQAGPLSDGVATQAGAAKEEAQASEGYAQATAGLVSYQFAPGAGRPPPVPGGPTAVPTIAPPPLPTTPGGSAPTPTPTPQPKPGPSPSPTPICIGNICLTQPVTNATGNIGRPLAATQSLQQIKLPDIFEQRLAALLRAAEVSDPRLLKLAGGHMAAADANLPYAAADEGGQATAQVSNGGVTVAVATHMTNIELFQGLITFATIDTRLKGQAPASTAQGRGTITTTITNAMIAGIPVTIDQNGMQVNNQGGAESQAVIQQLTDALNNALKAAGIQITMTTTTTMSDAGKWQGSGGGVQVTAEFAPGNGAPATHVNFTLGQVTGSMYAVPGSSSGSSGSGGGSCCFGSGGSGGFGSGSGGSTDNPSGSSNAPGTGVKSVISSIIGSLNAGEMLALLFVVQGCSTAAVAAAANAAETAARVGVIPPEEETQ